MSSAPAPALTPEAVAQTRTFMNALLDGVPDNMHGTLWTRQGLSTLWVPMDDGTGAARATAAAGRLAKAGKDVYFGVSLARKPGTTTSRIDAASAAGIFGLWADIDVADPDVHKKWNLPPTVEAAHELLDAVGMKPTMVIHSGHGLQAWWLFKEFWEFTSEDDRLAAAGLSHRWNQTLQARAAERSWVIDSTYDLSRVFRVPGTLNFKGDPVVPVRILSHDDSLRYDHEDFDEFCVDDSYLASRGLTPTRAYVPDELVLTDAMRPDFEKMELLRENTELFEPTWDRKRKDLTDQTASTYDMSLASQAARAGWSDQEIAALILAWRRKHKEDLTKALRVDYIGRTIARARESMARTEAAEALEDVGETLQEAKATNDDEVIRPARRNALDAVGALLGLEVLHIIKYLSDPAAFAIATPTATIPLGDRDGILRWDKFRGSIWEAVGHQIPRFPTAQWDRITELIPRAWEEQDVGAEATERGELAAWLSGYLALRPPVDTVEEAIESEYPFLERIADGPTGRVLMFGESFKRYLYQSDGTRITRKDMGRRLRDYGCEPDKVNIRDASGARTTRAVWRLPAGMGGPEAPPAATGLSVAS